MGEGEGRGREGGRDGGVDKIAWALQDELLESAGDAIILHLFPVKTWSASMLRWCRDHDLHCCVLCCVQVFGAVLPQTLRRSERYFGDGQTFLFSCQGDQCKV